MLYKNFEYGYSWKNVLEFARWWIKSQNFSQDIKKGVKIEKSGIIPIRDIEHTIRVIEENEFELIIQKNAIFSDDRKPRKLEKDEFYLNKGPGFEISLDKVEKWLQKINETNPYIINSKKAQLEQRKCNIVGICYNIESIDQHGWKLKITADVIALEK